MRVIISDIHSNIEAFQVVLDDIKARGFKHEEIVCLGDFIGYGPNPRESILLARGVKVALMGNHEDAALFAVNAMDFNEKARQAVEWTISQLNNPAFSRDENRELWNFLGELKYTYEENGFLYVHGSPRKSLYTREYVLPKDIENPDKMTKIFSSFDRNACFVGHTHYPGVFTEEGKFFTVPMLGGKYQIEPGKKVIVNVGSVGQPRDGNNNACFVVISDDNIVEWVRLAYPFKETMKKIFKIPALPDYLAGRLELGK